MDKKVNRIIATALVINIFSTIEPMTWFDFVTTKVYAETIINYSVNVGELKSLDVQSTEGKSFELCDEFNGNKIDITQEKTYYITLDGKNDGIKIFAEVEGEDYIAKVFESERKYATPHDIGENIAIESGRTTLYVRTYTSKEALKRAVDNKDVTNCEKTYKLNINKSTTNGTNDIYLDKLTLDSGKIPINFDRSTFSYNISVNEDLERITIESEPEDYNYSVKVNGFNVNEDNKYKKDISLSKGKNQIKVNVTEDDQKIRTYTLNIFRGQDITQKSDNNSSTSSIVQHDDITVKSKFNQWILVNGTWQYNDSTGNPLKNSWYYDKNYDKTYYLREDGAMAKDWLNINGSWYYFGQDGTKKTGWQNIKYEWYYLDSNGVMKIGWISDLNGKYYYLQLNGIMAKNTKVNGYTLGTEGAWIN